MSIKVAPSRNTPAGRRGWEARSVLSFYHSVFSFFSPSLMLVVLADNIKNLYIDRCLQYGVDIHEIGHALIELNV